MAEAGHRGEVETVEAASTAADPSVRRLALSALLRLGRLDGERLIPFFEDGESSIRRRAAELAPRVPNSKLLEPALRGLLDDEAMNAEMAAFALGEVGSADGVELDPETVAALERVAREHDDPLCREAAVAALGALHTGLDTILHACSDRATVRRRAIIALSPFDGPEVDAALRKALDDRDWQVRQAAEDLLGIAGQPVSDESDSTT